MLMVEKISQLLKTRQKKKSQTLDKQLNLERTTSETIYLLMKNNSAHTNEMIASKHARFKFFSGLKSQLFLAKMIHCPKKSAATTR